MRIALVLSAVVLALGCSSGGSSGNLTQRCMTACARNNSVCSGTADCAAQCNSAGAMAATAFCGNEVAAGFTCSEGLSDANLCGATGLAMCSAQITALQNCINAHSDAGGGDDAGM